jgi:type II secretory pathway pseudopilin PulG
MTRRGMTMLELLFAGALLAALATVCLQMLSAAAAQRRAADDRQRAILEAANLMERLSTVSFEKLTPEGVGQVQLSEEARRALPGGELEIQLTSAPEEPEAKRIILLLRWQDHTGQFVRPVWLVAWRYRGI